MKAVLFDLDDTLYPEIDFVKGGFRAVAGYLSPEVNVGDEIIYRRLVEILHRSGRGSVFDILLQQLGLSQDYVRLLVYLYRTHSPQLRLFSDALPTIQALINQGVRLGMVTDGMASVQRRKISALNLHDLFEVVVCSDELGMDHWKPSRTPFEIALDILRVHPHESTYVGDDVSKDFFGPNSMGMCTIQIARGKPRNASENPSELGKAKHIVRTLDGILPIIKRHGGIPNARHGGELEANGGVNLDTYHTNED